MAVSISVGGIGPNQVLWALDPTVVPLPPYEGPTGACGPAPVKYSDGTVQLSLFFENTCCHVIESSHIGKFNVCHNANGPFSGIMQAMGQKLFDRGIHIVPYLGRDCTGGSAAEISLSNSKGCQGLGGSQFLSYMIKEVITCAAPGGPGVQSDSTVTMQLFSDATCCAVFETTKMGVAGTCHDSNKDFYSFAQAVGTKKFGQNIHIKTYSEKGCGGTTSSFDLTNDPICNKQSTAWKSFKIQQDCKLAVPAIKSDTTVSLAFYGDNTCCASDDSTSLGVLETCHDAKKPFRSFSQAVGQSMFGRQIHIEAFRSLGCVGTSLNFDLSNKEPHCDQVGLNDYLSYRLHVTAPVCAWKKSVNLLPSTVTLELYSDLSCCTYLKQAVIGVVDKCYPAAEGLLALSVAPGANWPNPAQIVLFASADCSGEGRLRTLEPSLADFCLFSEKGSIGSYKLIKAKEPTIPEVPEPPRGPIIILR